MIYDPVHKAIMVHPLCLKIIDTPEFQRLRDIKQCGTCFFVYPSAIHTRFEHSIGVYYLAGVMLDCLMKRYSDRDSPIISQEEHLCVQIAGLCHDIGHGPFSHLWERFVYDKTGINWRHEDMSTEIFRHLIEKNDLKKEFLKYNLDDSHINLIMDIIAGNSNSHKDKLFLFEIVANKKTNIDVDRWDYLMRDAYFFGIICPVEYSRILSYIQIRETPDGNRIEFRDKLKSNLLELFENRLMLHKKCYQHKVCKIIEQMVIDALNEGDSVFFDDRELTLSSIHEDTEMYLTLSDRLIHNILNSSDQKLKKSKDILLRIFRRKLYQVIFEEDLNLKLEKDTISAIKDKLESVFQSGFRVVQIELSMGVQGDNPFENVLFYSKTGDELKQLDSPQPFRKAEKKLYILSINEMDQSQVQEARTLICEICPELKRL